MAFSQSTYFPLDEDLYHDIDRYISISELNDAVHTSFKPYRRKETTQAIVSSLDTNKDNFSKVDLTARNYYAIDSWEYTADTAVFKSKKPILNALYKNKATLYHAKTKDFSLDIRPVFHFSVGQENTEESQSLFINTRGISLRGEIDQKISFYTSFTENQAIFPAHVQAFEEERTAVPGFGFWKSFNDTGYDFIQASGYLDFQLTKHINLQFGQDKNFVGDGMRSMILSDFSNNYPFLKIRTKIWKLQYTNLFAQLVSEAFGDRMGSFGTQRFPKKFFAFHHLSFNVSKKLNIGLFEAIVTRSDSANNNTFELAYLNPIIFYRGVEQQTGSADNTVLGMDFRWNIFRTFKLYGQLGLDELIVSELFSGEGAWQNKYFGQLGFNYYNLMNINNLDFNSEINVARPYLYSHNTTASYTHFNQPLAHPLGANFYEILSELRYRPIYKVLMTSRITFAKYGNDQTDSDNFGKDIFKSNEEIAKIRPFGNTIGQGVSTTLIMLNFRTSYMLKHNLFIDLSGTLRTVNSDDADFDKSSQYIKLGVRLNSSILNHNY